MTRHRRWRELSAAALVSIGVMVAFVAPTKPAQAAAGGDHLALGQVLNPGEWIASGSDVLIMQADGNLVLYASQWVPLWSSITPGNSGARAIMQSDGNLVIYSQRGPPLWASNMAGWTGSGLYLQSSGNVVIRAPGNPEGADWWSNPYPQIRWGQGYIKGRYDTPRVAWWMWNSRNPHWC